MTVWKSQKRGLSLDDSRWADLGERGLVSAYNFCLLMTLVCGSGDTKGANWLAGCRYPGSTPGAPGAAWPRASGQTGLIPSEVMWFLGLAANGLVMA